MWCFPPSQDDPHFSLHPEEIRDSLWQGRYRDTLQAAGSRAPLSWGINSAPAAGRNWLHLQGHCYAECSPRFKPGLPGKRRIWSLAETLWGEEKLSLNKLWRLGSLSGREGRANKGALALQWAAKPTGDSGPLLLFSCGSSMTQSGAACAASLLCKCSKPGKDSCSS